MKEETKKAVYVDFYEKGKEIIDNTDADTFILAYNEFAELHNYENSIYYMPDFESVMGDSFSEIYPKLGDNFSDNDDYWYFDGLGNIQSCSYFSDFMENELDYRAFLDDIFAGNIKFDDDDMDELKEYKESFDGFCDFMEGFAGGFVK